jgi:hypothetical protein
VFVLLTIRFKQEEQAKYLDRLRSLEYREERVKSMLYGPFIIHQFVSCQLIEFCFGSNFFDFWENQFFLEQFETLRMDFRFALMKCLRRKQ